MPCPMTRISPPFLRLSPPRTQFLDHPFEHSAGVLPRWEDTEPGTEQPIEQHVA